MHDGATAYDHGRWPTLERRSAGRISFGTRLHFRNRRRIGVGRIRNVSMEGLFLEAPPDFQLGERLALDFRFRYARKDMRLEGEIIRLNADGIGVRFIW